MVDLYHPVIVRCRRVTVIESLRAYRTTKAHEFGVGWCLHLIDANANVTVQKFWFKDLMSMFSFVLSYPEGGVPNEAPLR
jgi:hypothetical protein